MVRFIMTLALYCLHTIVLIYIPIWLDLLSVAVNVIPLSADLFTFQYG